jgi:hypothetical protein
MIPIRKVVDITGKRLDWIQKLVDKNPAWTIVSNGSTTFSETHVSENYMYSDPPKTHDFIIFETTNPNISLNLD